MKKYVLFFALFTNIIYAEYTLVDSGALQSTHNWEHVGTSFMIQTASYGVFKSIPKIKKWEAIMFSMATTFLVTSLYSIGTNDTNMGTTMGMNLLGSALSVGTCLTFKFGDAPESISEYEKKRRTK